ncbi:unnamed protein product [Camellia sinensis]
MSRQEDNPMMGVNNDIITIKADDGSDTVTFMFESPSKLLLVFSPPALFFAGFCESCANLPLLGSELETFPTSRNPAIQVEHSWRNSNIGIGAMNPLTANSAYQYRKKLQFDHTEMIFLQCLHSKKFFLIKSSSPMMNK